MAGEMAEIAVTLRGVALEATTNATVPLRARTTMRALMSCIEEIRDWRLEIERRISNL
jgi:hypothetical protein